MHRTQCQYQYHAMAMLMFMLTVEKSNIVTYYYWISMLLLRMMLHYNHFLQQFCERLGESTRTFCEIQSTSIIYAQSSVSLKEVSDDFLDGDVADRLAEEERLHALGGDRVQPREEEQQTAEADLGGGGDGRGRARMQTGGGGRLRLAVLLQHQVGLILQKLNLGVLPESSNLWKVMILIQSQGLR